MTPLPALRPVDAQGRYHPGWWRMSAALYHTDPCPEPSLSAHAAITMVSRSPAHCRAEHPRFAALMDEQPAYRLDKGAVAHALLLGQQHDIEVVDADDWKTTRAKGLRDAARAAGRLPVLAHDFHDICEMVESLRRQLLQFEDLPAPLRFDLTDSVCEATIIHHENGCWFRARPDLVAWCEDRIILADYKTTEASAQADAVSRRIGEMGWDLQLAFYRWMIRQTIGPDCPDIDVYVISQEMAPPYGVSVLEVSPEYLILGWKDAARAMTLWKQCMESGVWPSYPPLIGTALPPSFIENRRIEREEQAAFLGGPASVFFDLPPDPTRNMTPDEAAAAMGGLV